MLVLLSWLAAVSQTPVMAPTDRALSAWSEDRHRRFDFWVGAWDVHLRMLQDDGRFEDSVAAVARIYSLLEGRAVLELWDSAPIKGYSLRYFDAEAGEWVLWLNWPGENRSRTSSLTGGFRHGRGDFFAERTSAAGETTRFRYSFNDITPFSLRWDDHTSTDGGESWRPNWVMEFTRKLLEPEWPIPREAVPTFETGGRCSLDGFRPYESLEGAWTGTFDGRPARLSAYRVLDGCAVIVFLDARRFGFLTFDTVREAVNLDWLTDDAAEGLERFWGRDWTALESEPEPESETGAGAGARFEWLVEGDRLEMRRRGADGTEEIGRFER